MGLRYLFYTILICSNFWLACQSDTGGETLDTAEMSGEELAHRFCSRCHLFTDPSLLTKTYWKPVLDRMALHLGMDTGVDPLKGKILEEAFMIGQAGLFPPEPVLTDSIWERLVDYYMSEAPDSFPPVPFQETQSNELFEESFPPLDLGGFPVVTMVQFDTQRNQLYVADLNNQLLRLNSDFSIDQISAFLAPVVHLSTVDSLRLLATQIGFMDNVDQKAGLVEMTDQASLSQRARILIELIRPVFTEIGDLDGDRNPDLLVSSFGNLVGDLSWYSYDQGNYSRHILRDKPGTLQTRILDANGDGAMDVLALFGQAEEGVSLFTNMNGEFQERKLLQFHPLYGCTDFEVLDFDGDQDLDIVLVNGDNGDYSFVVKPYHGVRIFENVGGWTFEEKLFIPIAGATGVECADFDLDGDLDLVVNCFYPDVQHLEESILYLENLNNTKFLRKKFNAATQGRWLVSDIGDIDEDGDLDIFLGSFALGPGQFSDSITSIWRSQEKHLLYLENKIVDR